MISIREVSKDFGGTPVLRGVDLEIGEGLIFGLLGPNGAGKTTLLNIVSCQLRPSAGEAAVDGLSTVRDAAAIRAGIGLVPQEAAVYRKLTVRENLALMASLHGMAEPARSETVSALLERVGLAGAAGTRAEHCSTGMRQALNIAMGLVHDPAVILLDEPTEGLDPAVRRSVWGLFRELSGRGRTLLLTTHILNEAERYCDKVAFLHHGRVLAVGSSAEVREELMRKRSAEREGGAGEAETFEDVFVELMGEGS